MYLFLSISLFVSAFPFMIINLYACGKCTSPDAKNAPPVFAYEWEDCTPFCPFPFIYIKTCMYVCMRTCAQHSNRTTIPSKRYEKKRRALPHAHKNTQSHKTHNTHACEPAHAHPYLLRLFGRSARSRGRRSQLSRRENAGSHVRKMAAEPLGPETGCRLNGRVESRGGKGGAHPAFEEGVWENRDEVGAELRRPAGRAPRLEGVEIKTRWCKNQSHTRQEEISSPKR